MLVITLKDLIDIAIVVIFIVAIFIWIAYSVISNIYKEKSKKWHNCVSCKYHYYRSTPDWYSCKKNLYDGSHSCYDVIWTKCKEYEPDE